MYRQGVFMLIYENMRNPNHAIPLADWLVESNTKRLQNRHVTYETATIVRTDLLRA